MIEQGQVYKIEKDGKARVRFPRTTACKNCNMCFKPKAEMFAEVTVQNTLNAAEGDTVSVSMSKRAVLGASIIVYLIPVLFVGVILALTYQLDPVLSFVFALVGLVLSEGFIILTDRVLRNKTEYMPKMVEIIAAASSAEVQNDGSDLSSSACEIAGSEGAKDLDKSKSEVPKEAELTVDEIKKDLNLADDVENIGDAVEIKNKAKNEEDDHE